MDSVRIWEERIVLPTYEVGQTDKNPMFLEGRVYQGSSTTPPPCPRPSCGGPTPPSR